MKRFLTMLFALTLSLCAAAFAAESPVLPRPPQVSSVEGAQENSLWVVLEYNDQSQAELNALAKSVNKGKSELEHFALSDENQAEFDTLGIDKGALSADEMLYVTVGGYATKHESITFKVTFAVPYPVDTKLAVLMGTGEMPGPYQWSVQNGVVGTDGTIAITLNNFPADPFLLSILN